MAEGPWAVALLRGSHVRAAVESLSRSSLLEKSCIWDGELAQLYCPYCAPLLPGSRQGLVGAVEVVNFRGTGGVGADVHRTAMLVAPGSLEGMPRVCPTSAVTYGLAKLEYLLKNYSSIN